LALNRKKPEKGELVCDLRGNGAETCAKRPKTDGNKLRERKEKGPQFCPEDLGDHGRLKHFSEKPEPTEIQQS